MKKLALITGASVGIGKELARVHAAAGGDLIITARRADALNALKAELEAKYNTTVHVIALDLGAPGGADALYEAVAKLGLKPDYLMNNAGFGGHGNHIERSLADEHAMIDLNIKALVTLCHRFGADMAARGSGKILNVGSTAGMMPGPSQAIYFASKAFVNSFSQALSEELKPSGVSVTVLVPGPVRTEFFNVAGFAGSALAKAGKSAESVAAIGYRAMMKGRLMQFNEARLEFILTWLAPLSPRRLAMRAARRAMAH